MTDAYNATHQNANHSSGVDSRGSGSDPLEKDFSNNHNEYHLNNNMDPANALNRIRTTGSLSISPELFEKIYLSPQNKVAGDLRKTFANPTPLALIGFLLSLTPLACTLMGWRGAGGNGAANVGTYYAFGGILMILGSLGEWVIGNTFPFVVFGSFGAFWLTFGLTLTPELNAQTAYTVAGGAPEDNVASFYATFGFVLLWMGFLSLIYLICALRTNVVFVMIFATLVPAFSLLAAAYWHLALGKAGPAETYQIAAGACTFVTCVCGWWIFFAILLASLDFPFQLPVGDLSTVIKGASEKKKAKELAQNESEYGLGV